MIASPRFWNRIARKYAAQPIADPASYERKLALTQARFQPDWRILEVGCGTGSTALRHAPLVAQVDATDFAEGMIAIARQRQADAGAANVAFSVASVADSPRREGGYDAVLALSLLHLLPERAADLAQLVDRLRSGGLLITSTPCITDGALWLRLILRLGVGLRLFPFVASFTSVQLRRELTDAGLVIEEDWLPAKGKARFIIARKAGQLA